MKLRNKKTGEVVDLSEGFMHDVYCGDKIEIKPVAISNKEGYVYGSLAELNEEWEDYEEPKTFWAISWAGEPEEYDAEKTPEELKEMAKAIGNYFETKEEAEQAVEKLKAGKRLKDKGLHVTTFYVEEGAIVIRAKTRNSSGAENWEDLDLLFGGEE